MKGDAFRDFLRLVSKLPTPKGVPSFAGGYEKLFEMIHGFFDCQNDGVFYFRCCVRHVDALMTAYLLVAVQCVDYLLQTVLDVPRCASFAYSAPLRPIRPVFGQSFSCVAPVLSGCVVWRSSSFSPRTSSGLLLHYFLSVRRVYVKEKPQSPLFSRSVLTFMVVLSFAVFPHYPYWQLSHAFIS